MVAILGGGGTLGDPQTNSIAGKIHAFHRREIVVGVSPLPVPYG